MRDHVPPHEEPLRPARRRPPFKDADDPRAPNRALRSVVVASVSWILGVGGFVLWEARTPTPLPGMQANYDHDVPLLVVAAVAFLIGPPVGVAQAIIALCRQSNRRGLAMTGLCLNLWVWGRPLTEAAVYAIPQANRAVARLPGADALVSLGLCLAGIVAAVAAGVWFGRRQRRTEPTGFSVETSTAPDAPRPAAR